MPGTSTRIAKMPPDCGRRASSSSAALLPRARDEQRLQIRSAERAHRRAHRRQRKLAEHPPFRRHAHDLAALVERAPVAAFAVDATAVRPVAFRAPARERPLPRRRPGSRVVVVRVHDARRRVGVVHRAPVRAPRETVADHHVVEHCRETTDRDRGDTAPPVFASRFSFIVPGEEAPLPIAAPVVEAMVRGIVGRIGELALEPACASASQMPPRSATTNPPLARIAKQPIDSGIGIAVLRPVDGIEAVERGRVDVDPPQRLVVDRPDRAFAEACLDVEHAGERGARSSS